MQRELEIKDYKTIWVMAHKIRKGMSDRDAHYRLVGLGGGWMNRSLGRQFLANEGVGLKGKPWLSLRFLLG